MGNSVDQTGASAGADIVGGDKVVHHHYQADKSESVVAQLLDKLRLEVQSDEKIRHTVENLQFFYEHVSHDGVTGLEAKLSTAKRDHELTSALEKKEHFAKLLEKWSLYGSAQELFAYFLARAEHEFTLFVLPKLRDLKESEINQLIHERIVLPTIMECGTSVFTLNHATVMGMVYWLAEQCYVRWHQ
jgi:DNA-dependent RNA polymerase auxiliary subunit epsilon